MPRSLSHLALIVADPNRTAKLFADVFEDAVLVRDNMGDDRHPGVTVRLAGTDFELIRGDGPASRNGDHIAFRVGKAEQLACARRLSALAIEYQMARNDTALYFGDYDNHVFELDVEDEDAYGREVAGAGGAACAPPARHRLAATARARCEQRIFMSIFFFELEARE